MKSISIDVIPTSYERIDDNKLFRRTSFVEADEKNLMMISDLESS